MLSSPKGSAKPSGGPGWFSRSPAMAVLAARLPGLKNAGVFNGLRSMLQPAVSFANAILARLTAREPVHPSWHGQLHLQRQTKAGRKPTQPIFRRLVERLSTRGERQRALRTLSVPDSLLDALEPDFSLPDIQSASSEFLDNPFEAPLEFTETNPPLPSAQTEEPAQTPAPTLPARQTVLARSPVATAAARHPAQTRAAAPTQPAPWPFKLVESRQTARLTPTIKPQDNRPEPAGSRSGASPTQRLTRADRQPTDRQALRASQRLTPAEANHPLQIRPMTLQQAHMPVTTVRFPAALTERAHARAHAPETQPGFSPERGSTHPGFGQRPARSEIPNRAGSHPVPETSEVPPVLVGNTVRSANTVVSTSTRSPAPHATLGGLALLRTPAAMLGLSPASPGRPGQPTLSSELAKPTPQAAHGTPPQPVEREWPLFGLLRQLEASPQPAESSALQHLRRMWPQSQLGAGVSAAFEASAALGPGEPLSPSLRGRMETQLGRPLGEVRLHESPIAQMLQAEAFTSGLHVVFAPGRLNPGAPAGLALLGHELSHIGQPLAFKTESGAGALSEDSSEQAARQQEEQIRSVIQQGWPEPAPRAYRQTPQAHIPAHSAAAVQRAVVIDEVETQPAQQDTPSAPTQSGAQGGQASGAAPVSAGAQPPANVDALARQVYSILKDRLRAERTRHELYGRS